MYYPVFAGIIKKKKPKSRNSPLEAKMLTIEYLSFYLNDFVFPEQTVYETAEISHDQFDRIKRNAKILFWLDGQNLVNEEGRILNVQNFSRRFFFQLW